ncbi:MAG TPA: hypothetical protein VHJ20_04380 [Polyangia bacterium]|nr:hypothetical protein [Polyangia bacterium]
MPSLALLLLIAAATSASEAPRAKETAVEIAIAAPSPDVAEAVRDDLRELLGRVGVGARYRDVAGVDRAEVLRPTNEAPCALACVWLDLDVGAPGHAVVYVSATASEQVVIRRMPLPAGVDEVAREEVAHIVAGSIEALRSGRPLPTAGAGDARVSVLSTAPAAPPPPPAPTTTVLLGGGAGALLGDAGQTAAPALALSMLFAVDHRFLSPALWLEADGFAGTMTSTPVGLRFRGGDLTVLAAVATPSAPVVARFGAGLGAELLSMTPVLNDATSGATLDGARLQPELFARAAARVELRAATRVGVFLSAACDARFVVHRDTIVRDGVSETLYEPRRFRPWIVLGVDAVLGGAETAR